MKIKKFRIKPRLPVVGKILKALMSTKKLPPEIEESLPQEIEEFNEHVTPAAFYQSWPQASMPSSFSEVMSTQQFEHAIAVTAVVATIGPGAEEHIAEVLLKGEAARSQVIQALSEEAADLSFNFIYRLLVDDAKNDDCEVSEPVFINDSSLVADMLTVMEAEQEGVTVDSAQHLSPRFTRVALVAWWPSKKKRAAAVQKKRAS